MEQQIKANWCWAAVAVSVKHFFSSGSAMTQCQVAQPVLIMEQSLAASPKPDCCRRSDDCDMPALLQDALTFVHNLSSTIRGPLSFAQLKEELNSGRPVAARIEWPNGGGHFIVLDGFREFTSGAEQVQVADPQYGPSYPFYDELVAAYLDVGTWTDTFLLRR